MKQTSRLEEEERRVAFDLTNYTPRTWTTWSFCEGLVTMQALGTLAMYLLYPLNRTAAYGRTDIVQLMLDKGYDKDVLDEEGSTPLQLAASMGHMPVTGTLLAAGAYVSLQCQRRMDALDWADFSGRVDVAGRS